MVEDRVDRDNVASRICAILVKKARGDGCDALIDRSEDIENVKQDDDDQGYAKQPGNDAFHRILRVCVRTDNAGGGGWFRMVRLSEY